MGYQGEGWGGDDTRLHGDLSWEMEALYSINFEGALDKGADMDRNEF